MLGDILLKGDLGAKMYNLKSEEKNIYRCLYIYIYIKWTMFVNVTTKSAQHAHAWMIAIIVEKSTYDLSLDFFQQLYIYMKTTSKTQSSWWIATLQK